MPNNMALQCVFRYVGEKIQNESVAIETAGITVSCPSLMLLHAQACICMYQHTHEHTQIVVEARVESHGRELRL